MQQHTRRTITSRAAAAADAINSRPQQQQQHLEGLRAATDAQRAARMGRLDTARAHLAVAERAAGTSTA